MIVSQKYITRLNEKKTGLISDTIFIFDDKLGSLQALPWELMFKLNLSTNFKLKLQSSKIL